MISAGTIPPTPLSSVVIMTNCCICGIETHQHISWNISLVDCFLSARSHFQCQSQHSGFSPPTIFIPVPISHHPFFLSSIFLSADTTLPKLKSILYGVWLHTLNCYVLCLFYAQMAFCLWDSHRNYTFLLIRLKILKRQRSLCKVCMIYRRWCNINK